MKFFWCKAFWEGSYYNYNIVFNYYYYLNQFNSTNLNEMQLNVFLNIGGSFGWRHYLHLENWNSSEKQKKKVITRKNITCEVWKKKDGNRFQMMLLWLSGNSCHSAIQTSVNLTFFKKGYLRHFSAVSSQICYFY